MRILQNPVFLLAAVLFWITYIAEYLKVFTFPVVHNYLDDVLAMPVILTLAVAIQRQWVYRNPEYILSKFQVAFAVFYVSILFEVILPLISIRYTRDYWDILAYTVGSLVFYRFINRSGIIPLQK